MRILFLTPGSGDRFYCENCLRDKAVVVALRQAGHDAASVPLYLPPLAEDTDSQSGMPVFFGGVNVLLQQRFWLFRHTPRWMDRLFDASWLLRWAGRRAGATRPEDLGEMTVSMLAGQDGRQAKELDRLVRFLAETGKGDAVVLSNALLLGLAPRIKAELGALIVCLLQDEHELADALRQPFRRQAWQLMREKVRAVDAVAAASGYYARQMADRLHLPVDQIHVIPNGVDPEGYVPSGEPPQPPAVGYLSRMHPRFGLDSLAEAFIRLRTSDGARRARLVVAGGMTAADKDFVRAVRRRIGRAGLAGEVDWPGDFDRQAKRELLPRLSVMCVPGRAEAAAGLFVLESLAAGVPVVAPACGVYPELLGATGGGLLFAPGNLDDLTSKLQSMLCEPDRARRIGLAARQVVIHDYSAAAAARQLLAVLEPLAGKGRSGRTP